ncbi:Uncharacterized protein ChrSV_3358 [Chromobacterium vaccinii]|nr:Uncharacterized protein ChrSW_3358 [Chromobacterium vaccinii]QND90815.1 Uncharacterized protein ChrSV_3358 [Chromobacterium vaccinii]
MNISVIKSVIEHFVSDSVNNVLAISGQWGTGKTYTTREVAESYGGVSNCQKYSYISLFGAQSIAEIRTAILLGSKKYPLAKHSISNSRHDKYEKASRIDLREVFNNVREVLPYKGKNIAIALETIAGAFIKNTLIIIDDIERLGDKISMPELMGLINELKGSMCKIIMILNENEMAETQRVCYEKHLEKIVDKKIIFDISTGDAVGLGLKSESAMRDDLIMAINRLNVRNIRIINKIGKMADEINSLIYNSSSETKRKIAVSLSVLICSKYERERGCPSLDQILKYNGILRAMRKIKSQEYEINDEWSGILSDLGFSGEDAFNKVILGIVNCGYAEGSGIEQCAKEMDEMHAKVRMYDEFRKAWMLFHDRIDNSDGELAKKLAESAIGAAVSIEPVNINATIKLIRRLGFEDLADNVIEGYIEARRSTPLIFNVDHEFLSGQVDDPKARKRFSEVYASSDSKLSWEDVSLILTGKRGWDEKIYENLSNATVEDFIELLKLSQGSNLAGLVKRVLEISRSREGFEGVREKMLGALRKIESESKSNQEWVKMLGDL